MVHQNVQCWRDVLGRWPPQCAAVCQGDNGLPIRAWAVEMLPGARADTLRSRTIPDVVRVRSPCLPQQHASDTLVQSHPHAPATDRRSVWSHACIGVSGVVRPLAKRRNCSVRSESSRAIWANGRPLSAHSRTASSLNSRLNYRRFVQNGGSDRCPPNRVNSTAWRATLSCPATQPPKTMTVPGLALPRPSSFRGAQHQTPCKSR